MYVSPRPLHLLFGLSPGGRWGSRTQGIRAMWSLWGHSLPLSKTRNSWLPSTAGQGQTRKDCQVTIALRVARTPGRHHIPLHRLDWRALRGHTNPRVRASAWSGKTVSDTHFHDFDINWDAAKERFYRRGLRLAREIDPPAPQSFDEVLAWVSREFRIGNRARAYPSASGHTRC